MKIINFKTEYRKCTIGFHPANMQGYIFPPIIDGPVYLPRT